MASRGWALHDRQTTLFGEVGEPGDVPVPGRVLFKEIDDRPGYYAGLHLRYFDRAELRYMHYDNRADPEEFDRGHQRLCVADLLRQRWPACRDRERLDFHQPMAARRNQYRAGIGLRRMGVQLDIRSRRARRSASIAFPCGPTGSTPIISRRASRRETPNPDPPGPQAIHTSAMITGTSPSRRSQIKSDVSSRAYIGEPPRATEKQLQLQVRYSL